MVYARPRTDAAVSAAVARAKATAADYRRVVQALPQDAQDAISARIRALTAEAAAQRTRAVRAENALEALRAERGRR